MSCHCFDEIIASLSYTKREVLYEDGLLNMRQTEEPWNKNMANEFNPYLINVINKSMMEWYNKFPPGFICVGSKLHLFGNEHHPICYGIASILWRAYIVNKKDRPAQLVLNLHSELGRTVGLMLQMCKPLFSTGKDVVTDSGFFVANGILNLQRRGRMTVLSSKSVDIGQNCSMGSHWP